MAMNSLEPMRELQSIEMESTTQFVIPKPHTLNGLPVELILSILDLLELEDILCLSMCNRQLFRALSRKRKLFPPAEGSRLEVLDRIVHDLPNHFLCDPCSILHMFDGPEWFAKTSWLGWPSRLPCVYQYEWYRDGIISQVHNILLWDRRRIYSDKLRLVMRWLYYGAQYGLGTESLYHTQVREHPESITLFSIEARSHLEQKGLCLRIQDILIVDNRRMDLFVPKHLQSPLHQSPPHFFWICEHLSHWEFLDIVKSMLSVCISKKSMPRLGATATNATQILTFN